MKDVEMAEPSVLGAVAAVKVQEVKGKSR